MDAKALREKRAKLIADARAIIDKADTEQRGLSADEVTAQRKLLDDAKLLVEQIRNAVELEQEERDIAASLPDSQRTRERRQEPDLPEERKAYQRALTSYLRLGFNFMSPEDQRALQTGYVQFDSRAQSTLSGAAGGFAVAPDTSMYGKVIEALKYFGGVEIAGATVLTTSTGADLPIATDDDTSNTGSIVAEEGSHASGTDVTMGQRVLHAYLYSSKIIKVSWQLLQDAEFDFEAYLSRKFGTRLGRAQNAHYTTGTGVAQPQGFVTAATVGRQSATGNSTSVPFDDVIRLIHSVDVAYRNSGCKFMTSDTTALALELLKDGDGQYLWQQSNQEGAPARIKGFPVVINNDMATMSASAKHSAFGDFSNYYIRRVSGIQVLRLQELYAANGQVGFMAFMRADGGLVDAGQGPIKTLQNSAS
jgi:HK97 family phage major capsid protein